MGTGFSPDYFFWCAVINFLKEASVQLSLTEDRLSYLGLRLRRTDSEMQEFIDTRGFFVRHGRQRRAALNPLPVAPSPEVDVAANSISSHAVEQPRQRRDTEDNGVRMILQLASLV